MRMTGQARSRQSRRRGPPLVCGCVDNCLGPRDRHDTLSTGHAGRNERPAEIDQKIDDDTDQEKTRMRPCTMG